MTTKLIIVGGTGRLGRRLQAHYKTLGGDVVVLTRNRALTGQEGKIKFCHWNGRTSDTWIQELSDNSVIINLAGKSIDCRFTPANRREILQSRIDATQAIANGIRAVGTTPKLWINASGISIYDDTQGFVTEDDLPQGQDFLADVTRKWEAAFDQFDNAGTRKVVLRIATVLQPNGGILKPLVNLARFGLGGRIGSGEQYLSWIHEADFLRLVDWVIVNEHGRGVVHASSPNPVKNSIFMKAIRKELGIPFGLPNYGWLARFGGWFIGKEAGLVLSGRRVVSKVLAEKGFEFTYAELGEALHDLMSKQKATDREYTVGR